MIEFLSSWAKGLGLAIVIVSILEMVLPNNKTKKYIRAIMGIYILFNIINPFIKNKEVFNVNEFDISNYTANTISTNTVNQTSMNERIEELYIEEIEKDITKKIEEQGYIVTKCKVQAKINDNSDDSKITKIKLNAKKSEVKKYENTNSELENTIVSEIQKIKTVDTSIDKSDDTSSDDSKLSKSDIQNIKKFLIDEYGVSENCLEIN